MPKLHQAILMFIGVLLTCLVFIFQTSSPRSERIDSANQTPIDPDTLTGKFDPSQVLGVFNEQEVISEKIDNNVTPQTSILGIEDDSEDYKRIEVDLTNQKVYAFEGDKVVYEFLISSGKWGRTPTGEFRIWGKFEYTKMSGGSKELRTYYYLPNVPFVMFFSNDEIAASRGFSLHGTYWHENFGHPMSHGCINMRTSEALKLFHWTEPVVPTGEKTARASKEDKGTKVIIYGEAPRE